MPQAQSEPALLRKHGSSSRDAQATEDSGGNTGAAAQPSDDSEEEEPDVGWKRQGHARFSSPQPPSKQPRCVAARPSAHVQLGDAADVEDAALHGEGSDAPIDAGRAGTRPASHSDAPQQSAHHTGAGTHVARTESMAAGGSSSVHEYDGSGVIQLTGDREPPNLLEQQQQPDTGETSGHYALQDLRADPARNKHKRPSHGSKERKRAAAAEHRQQRRQRRREDLEQQRRAASALAEMDEDLTHGHGQW